MVHPLVLRVTAAVQLSTATNLYRKYDCWAFTWQLPIGSLLAIAALICLEISAFHHDIDNASAVIGLFYTSA